MPQLQVLRDESRKTRRTLWRVGAIVIVAVLIVGWAGDYRSCERQIDVRQSLIDNRALNRDAIPYWERQHMPEVADRLRQRVRADSTVHIPNCDQVFPGT